jgi:hypothetical protein
MGVRRRGRRRGRVIDKRDGEGIREDEDVEEIDGMGRERKGEG